jgi:hypothetical protein
LGEYSEFVLHDYPMSISEQNDATEFMPSNQACLYYVTSLYSLSVLACFTLMVHPIKYACIRLLAYISVSMLYSDDAFSKVQVGTSTN